MIAKNDRVRFSLSHDGRYGQLEDIGVELLAFVEGFFRMGMRSKKCNCHTSCRRLIWHESEVLDGILVVGERLKIVL